MTEEQAEYTGVKVIDKRMKEEPETAMVAQGGMAVIQMAMQKNYSPELIEKMMALQERFEANEARKAFFEAKSAFKAEAPPVTKDAFNRQFNSYYTSLGNLLDTYNPILGKHGLSLSFLPNQQDDKSMTVTVTLSHRMGHSESISMSGPIDTAPVGKESGRAARNPLQNIKSTFTYLRSAVCEAILGVAGTEATQNDDGNGASDFITEAQVSEITDMMNDIGLKEETLCKLFHCSKIEEIPAPRYGEAMTALKDAKKRKEAKAQA